MSSDQKKTLPQTTVECRGMPEQARDLTNILHGHHPMRSVIGTLNMKENLQKRWTIHQRNALHHGSTSRALKINCFDWQYRYMAQCTWLGAVSHAIHYIAKAGLRRELCTWPIDMIHMIAVAPLLSPCRSPHEHLSDETLKATPRIRVPPAGEHRKHAEKAVLAMFARPHLKPHKRRPHLHIFVWRDS